MSQNNQTENERGSSDSLKLGSLRADQLNAVSQRNVQAAKEGNLKNLAPVMAPEFHFIDEHEKVFAAGGCSASLEETVSKPNPARVLPMEKIKVNSFDVKDVQTQKMGDIVIESMLYSDNVTAQPRNERTLVTVDRNFRWTNIRAQLDGTLKMVLTQLTSLDTGKEAGAGASRTGTTPAPPKQTLLHGASSPPSLSLFYGFFFS